MVEHHWFKAIYYLQTNLIFVGMTKQKLGILTIKNGGKFMPGISTHYIFGLNSYKKINNMKIKFIIARHKEVFSLGLQGPDIFFDYLPLYIKSRKNIARLLHTKNTGNFLMNMIHLIKTLEAQEEFSISLSYLYGFLGHYILDSETHPMIYYRTQYLDNPKDYISRHIQLENDINTILLKQYLNLDPFQINFKYLFHLTKYEERVITKLLSDTINKTYPELKLDNPVVNHTLKFSKYSPQFFIDKNGYKERIASELENIIFKYRILSTKFVTNTKITTMDPLNLNNDCWHNPWKYKIHSNQSFMDLFQQSITSYKELLADIWQYLEHGNDLNHIKCQIGNKSYHSGLECHM